MTTRDHIKCGVCGVEWPAHDQNLCPHGRKPAEYAAEPEPPKNISRAIKLINEGIVFQAVMDQLKTIERRLSRWFHWAWSYTECDRANDEYNARVLRAWLQEHQ